MEGKTHVLGAEAICLSLTVSGIYHPESLIAAGEFFIAAGIGALLHDIDTEHSTVSNKHRVIGCFVLTGDLPIHFLRVEYFFPWV